MKHFRTFIEKKTGSDQKPTKFFMQAIKLENVSNILEQLLILYM